MTRRGAVRDRMAAGRPSLAFVAGAGCLVIVGGCNSPAAVVMPGLEVVVASGDGQYGTVGQELSNPLRVLVRSLTGQLAQVGTAVSWQVLEGDASIIGSSATATDSTGSAQVRIRLGPSTGPVMVEATAIGRNNPKITFRAFTVDRPELGSVSPEAGAPGASITLSGANFSPDPEQNVVLFSGVRGRVTAASASSLTVRVPECLPRRAVDVSVQLGIVASGTRAFDVTEPGALESLAVGGRIDVADDEGYTCLGLPGDGAYLLIAYSSSTIGAAKHPYRLTGVASGTSAMTAAGRGDAASGVAEPSGPRRGAPGSGHPAAPPHPAARPLMAVPSHRQADPGTPQGAFDRGLRELEAALTRDRPSRGHARTPGAGTPQLAPGAAPPAVGDRRSFQVYSGAGSFTTVTAEALRVGAHAALFVDVEAPSGGFTASDLDTFSNRFDDAIHPVVTGTFGAESDLDGNERVVILFTPAVNALTPRGAGGFVAGFFYGIDLLPDQEGSNAGEVFYALVPDPAGVYSDPRPAEAVFDVTPAVLAHEFQHMVHFNQRVLLAGAESTEALWLSEGMAQYAEEAVALHYEDVGDAEAVELFRSGTRARARRYLTRPDTVSLIISTGEGSLEERGAGFLDVLYLQDQMGGEFLRRLTSSTRTGVSNLEVETGRPWPELLASWWSALYLDAPGPETGLDRYPDVDLRGFLGNPFPLAPVQLGAEDFGPADSLWSASAAYYIVTPSAPGSTTIRLGGEAGAPSSPQAGLRMRVVRIS